MQRPKKRSAKPQSVQIEPSEAASGSGSDSDSDSGPEELFRRAPTDAAQRIQRRMQQAAEGGDGSDDDAMTDSEASSEDNDDSAASSGSSSSDEEAGLSLEELAARHGDGSSPAGMLPEGADRLTAWLPHAKKRRKGGAGAPAHRENKNRPTEASSKRPIGRLRDVLQAPKPVRKDPRFEDLSGKYVPERFRKQYSFLYEEVLPQERSSLRSAAKKVKSAEQKQKLSEAARSAEATLREDAARQKKSQWESDLKAKERAAVRAGKKPFYLKKADKRKAELISKYEELKKAGKLEQYLAKRRRKNAAKDHRYVPGARREAA